MKNFFIFLLIVVIIVGMGYGAYKYFFDFQQTYIDDVVSEGALLYIKASTIKDNIDRIGATRLWKEISRVDYKSLMKEAGYADKQIQMVDLIISQLGSRDTQSILKYFFNDEVAFVFYPADVKISKITDFSPDSITEIVEKLLSNVSIVFRVGAEVEFAERLSQLFNHFGAKVTREEIKYNGYTLYVIKVTNLGLIINYAKINDLLVVGIGDIAAKRSYDVLDGAIPQLSSDKQFSQASERFYIDSDLEIFFNLKKSTDLLRDQAKTIVSMYSKKPQKSDQDGDGKDVVQLDKERIDIAHKNIDSYFKQLAGFNSVAVSTKWEGIYESRFLVFFDKSQISAEIAKNYSCPASENKSIDFIPEDALFYQWANCLDLAAIWEQMNKELGKFPDAEFKLTQVAAIEQSLGLSVKDDIVPTFAGEFGGYLKGINLRYLFPVPEVLLFVETKNREKAISVIEHLTQNPMLELKSENYSGIPFNYFVTPLGEAFEPGYCFIGKHLLISGSKDLLKKAIDAQNETALSLASNPGFRSVNIGLTDLNRGVQFVEFRKFAKEIRSVIKWAETRSSSKDEKKLAFKRGAEMKLEETKTNIANLKVEVSGLEKDYLAIEDEIWNIESIGKDVSAKRAELQDLGQKIKDKKDDLKALTDQERDLKITVDDFAHEPVSPELRKQLIEKAVSPILNGLESINAVGTRMTIDQVEGVLEANMYIDIAE